MKMHRLPSLVSLTTLVMLGYCLVSTVATHAQILYVSNEVGGTISKITFSSPGTFGSQDNSFITPQGGAAGLAFDSIGNLYIAKIASSITKVTFSSPGVVVTVNNNFATGFSSIFGLAFDSSGNLFVASRDDGVIKKITFSAPGVYGSTSTFASLAGAGPRDLAFDSIGNLYTVNQWNNTIGKITPGGVVSTFATGITDPLGEAFDSSGNLFVSDPANHLIDKITFSAPGTFGSMSTFALVPNEPTGLVFDGLGNLYATNLLQNRLDKVTPGGSVSTFSTGFIQPTFMAFQPTSSPEPGSLALLMGLSLSGSVFALKRRRNNAKRHS
jgi:DNA-binding beta-propeller fold protein YncE